MSANDRLQMVTVVVLESEGDPLLHPTLAALGGNFLDAAFHGLAGQGDGPLVTEGREAAGGEGDDPPVQPGGLYLRERGGWASWRGRRITQY